MIILTFNFIVILFVLVFSAINFIAAITAKNVPQSIAWCIVALLSLLYVILQFFHL